MSDFHAFKNTGNVDLDNKDEVFSRLAKHFLSKDHTDAQSIIENLFQLDLFKKVESKISEYWHHQTVHKGAKADIFFPRGRASLLNPLAESLPAPPLKDP